MAFVKRGGSPADAVDLQCHEAELLLARRLPVLLHRLGTERSTSGVVTRPLRWLSWAGFLTCLVWSNPLARGARARALVRFWSWQLWRRLPGRSIEISFQDGIRLWLPSWSKLAGLVAATGSHEPMEQMFLSHALREGDHVIDVGANVGFYTLRLCGLGAKVSAFEPNSAARSVLHHNVRLNGVESSVQVFPFALGAENGEAALTTDLDCANHLSTLDGTGSSIERVQLRALDRLMDDNRDWFTDNGLTVLKVDVEGHDAEVLLGARRLIATGYPVVLVETWDGGRQIRRFLEQLGYGVFRYDWCTRRLIEYPAGWSGQANFIAVAEARWEQVASRLETAPAGLIRPPNVNWLVAGPPAAAETAPL